MIKPPSTSQGKNATTSLMLYESTTIPPIISTILKRKISKPTTHRIPTPEELVCMCFKWAAPQEGPNNFVALPFINGFTQLLTRIPRRHDIQVVNKPLQGHSQPWDRADLDTSFLNLKRVHSKSRISFQSSQCFA